MNRHALCNCIEKAMGIEVSDRVKYIRTIMDELQRIDSHLLFFATFCMDFGRSRRSSTVSAIVKRSSTSSRLPPAAA